MVAIKKKRTTKKPKPRPKIEYPPVPTRKWVPPDKRPKSAKPPPAYLKPEGITQKLTVSTLKKIWHQYELYGDTGVLAGHYSQAHKKFSFKTNGYQGACNCAVACIFGHLRKMENWKSTHLDEILEIGDELYLKSIQQPSERCLVEVPPEKVFNAFFLGKRKVTFTVDDTNKITEPLTAISEQEAKHIFEEAIAKFFKLFPSGIFTMLGKHLALWIQDNAYYLFDPTEHRDNGDVWTGIPGYGVSLLYRCKTLKSLVKNLYKNVNAKTANSKFEIVGCTVQRVVVINTTPPETFEDIAPLEEMPLGLEETEYNKDQKPIDIVEENLRDYLESSADVTSLKVKVEEISPEISDTISMSKRPSWMTEGPINKMDVCKFPIPYKVHPKKVSYYQDISPQKIGILRATTCQTDPKFSKYHGRQSMGNAISALIMLRFYKSKVWVPNIVNTILKYGDLLYRDAMISIPRTQSLKLSNFQKKTEIEGRIFSPVIEDYVVVGKLGSQEYDVLDLHPALEGFLIDNESCVILGPIVLSVWVEDGKFYMFDPNERDQNGKAVTKPSNLSTNSLEATFTVGVACVLWFAHLEDLVHMYMENVEISRKMDPFYLSKVRINDFIEAPDPWYNFKGIVPGKWILRGTISQSSKKFSKNSRNFQSPACSLIAIALQGLTPLKDWSTETVDEILDIGDQLYLATVNYLTEIGSFENRKLVLDELHKTFKLYDRGVNFEISDCIINGLINTKNTKDLVDLRSGLEEFFKDNELGVVTTHNISVAVWKNDNVYYCFDSHNRDEKGLATGFGTACVLRTLHIEDLSNALEANLSPSTEDYYNISRIGLKFFESGEGDAIRPPLNCYTKSNDHCSILRSIYSEISNKYEINVGKQTIPMCLTALCFNKLKPAGDWTKQDLDEILNKGDGLYVQTMIELQMKEEEQLDTGYEPAATAAVNEQQEGLNIEDNDEEHEDNGGITLANVKNELIIGLNKFEINFEDVDEGNINDQLQDSLRTFYEGEQTDDYYNQEIILESKPLSVAIWRDDKVFYLFDSKPRDKEGKVIGMEDWSMIHVPREVAKTSKTKVRVEEPRTDESTKSEADTASDEFADRDLVTNVVNFDDMGAGDRFVEGETSKGKYAQQEEEEAKNEGKEEGTEEEEIQYFPVVHKSSSYWREKEKSGRACTMWFTNLNDLIVHINGNIPPKVGKAENFSLKSVKINNVIQVKDKLRGDDERNDVYSGDWYYFQEIEHGKWIMRGTMTIFNELFPEQNRGRQLIATCYASLAIASIFSIVCFNDHTVDSILTYGDKLYTFVKRTRKKQLLKQADKKLKEEEIDWLVRNEPFDIGDVPKKICISKFFVEVQVQPEIVVGDIKAQNFEDVLDVKRGMDKFFETNDYGLLQAKDLTVAIWRGQKMYYMFDGLNRGPNGVVSPNGTACITRYLNLGKMADVFLANISKYGKNTFYIHKVTMVRDLCPREREPKFLIERVVTVAEGGFQSVMPGKNIVRGNISQEDPKFGKGPNVMSAPIAIVALAMTLLHKTSTWSKPIVDDIVELGAQLYEETIESLGFDFNHWEDQMDIYKVKNDFKIGVLRANCELRLMDQKGIIDNKDPNVSNLRQGIEKFFEENTHGIIVSEPFTLAIWEEQNSEPLIYVFDPNPRSPTGMPVFTGTACLVSFVNAKMAADHIVACILEPEKKMCEFTIVPVEIVVGNVRMEKKPKASRSKSVTGVLPRCSTLVVDREKKMLRTIAENERKRKAEKRLQSIGRKGYYNLRGGDAIIRGYRSQNSDNYSDESRNNQDIPNCIVAIVMHHVYSIDTWTSKHIDLVLDTGDQLYIDSYIAYGPKDKKLGLENITRKFFLKNLEIHVTIYKAIITDTFTVNNVNRYLNIFFQQEQLCLLSYDGQWVSVFFKTGQYYVFDPHERDLEGNNVKKDQTGTSVVLRFDNLNNLATKLVTNFFDNSTEELKQFSLWLLSVDIRDV